MNPALWGLLTALSWGGADFIARFTGRAMGPHAALFAMLCVGAVVLSVIVWWAGVPLIWDASGLALLAVMGIGTMVATLLLYWGLARGPVTVVAPIAGGFPALNVAFAVIVGVRPQPLQWAAMAAVMVGVLIVARAARSFEDDDAYPAPELRKTIVIALAAAVAFAVTVLAAQESTRVYGALQAVWMARLISLLAITAVLACRREMPRPPARWWPLLVLQGLLDGAAYLALLLAGHGAGSEIAVVVASVFSVVTVILARLVLREAMTRPQWAGIVFIIGGVGMLSAH